MVLVVPVVTIVMAVAERVTAVAVVMAMVAAAAVVAGAVTLVAVAPLAPPGGFLLGPCEVIGDEGRDDGHDKAESRQPAKEGTPVERACSCRRVAVVAEPLVHGPLPAGSTILRRRLAVRQGVRAQE